MADYNGEYKMDSEVILKVGTDEAVKTVGDLRNNIKELKKVVDSAEIGTEKYTDALNLLKVNQNALKDANFATASSLETVTGAATGTTESYNALVHRMAAYKEEARAVDQSTAEGVARFNQLSMQINATNDKLKAMDAKMGNYQRNVGNYKSALDGFSGGMRLMGANASGVVGPLQAVTMGFKAMSATPVIAILGALIGLFTKLSSGISKSEEASHAMRRAMAAFEPVLNLTAKAAEKLGLGLAKIIEWAGKVISRLTGVKEATEAAIERTREQTDLEKTLRDQSVKEAELEAKVAALRLKAADKQTYSAQKRAEFLKEAEDAEKAFAVEALKNANKRAELAVKELNATVSGTADYEKANQALIAAYQEQAKWSQKLLQLKTAQNKVQKEVNKTEEGDLKELDDLIKQLVTDAEKGAADALGAWEKAQADALTGAKAHEDNRLKALADGTARRKELLERETLTAKEKEERVFEIEQDGMNRRLELLKQFRADAMSRGDLQLALDYETQIQDAEFDIEQAGYLRRKKLREQEISERRAALQGMVSSVMSILGAVADAYDAAGEATAAQAERVKSIRTAAAIIDTISGAVGAFMGITKDTGGWGIALAAAKAATVLATGMAQVAKIQNTDVSGKGTTATSIGAGMGSAAVNAPAPVQQVPVTRSLTSASEEARLNEQRNIRVQLVYSDVQAARERVQVVDSETEL